MFHSSYGIVRQPYREYLILQISHVPRRCTKRQEVLKVCGREGEFRSDLLDLGPAARRAEESREAVPAMLIREFTTRGLYDC